MAFFQDCVERATGLAAACGWLVLAQGGSEAVVGITVGAAGIAAAVSGAVRHHGPESAAALRAIRKRILADMTPYAASEGWEAGTELAEADAAMERALKGCFLDRAALAASARSPEGFPRAATALILARLAECEPKAFGAGGSEVARRHAERVISIALGAAIENEAYFRNLAPYLALETLRGIGGIEERLGVMHDDVRAMWVDLARRIENIAGNATATSASEVDKIHIELIVNDCGESMIFHNRRFPYPLDSVEYDPASGMIWFVIPGGFRKTFGVPVLPELARHLDRHTGRILVVRMDERTGEPIDGDYAPLRTI